MSERTIRIAGMAGIAFVVLILITVFAGGSPPALDDPVGKVRTYMVDHRSALLISNVIGLIAIPLVVWFAVVLRELFRGGDRVTSALSTASLGGLLITAPVAIIGGSINISMIYIDGVANKLGDDTVRVVYDVQALIFAGTSAGIVLFTLMAALAIRRSNVLPAYVMWVGFVAALGNVVTMFSTAGSGAAALGIPGVLTFALFILVGGITMAMGKATPAAT
ncbi:MAG TPA: hypothetical protein VGZ52_04785 [Acidimicrobiales bacterium]|nr:hypothetical protein [Acidimicrobiales bacterium]